MRNGQSSRGSNAYCNSQAGAAVITHTGNTRQAACIAQATRTIPTAAMDAIANSATTANVAPIASNSLSHLDLISHIAC